MKDKIIIRVISIIILMIVMVKCGYKEKIKGIGTALTPLKEIVVIELFKDNFSSTNIDTTKWSNSECNINDNGIEPPSIPYSLDIPGTASITSKPVDLSQYTNEVKLEFYIEETGWGNSPEYGEDLYVYCSNENGWVEIGRYIVSEISETNFESKSITIDKTNLHSKFRIRFSNPYGTGVEYDDWYIDNVRITTTEVQ